MVSNTDNHQAGQTYSPRSESDCCNATMYLNTGDRVRVDFGAGIVLLIE